MPAFSFSSLPTNSSNNFYQWAKPLSNCIANCGLVQTSDTGQIDWAATLATPPAIVANTTVGYEIFRFADTLQSTAPIYLKVEYAAQILGSSSNTIPAVFIRFASNTNGSGTLTGNQSDRIGLMSDSTGGNTGTSFTTYVSGDTNRLTILQFAGVSGGSPASRMRFYNLERTHAANGADTNVGMIVCFSNNSGAGTSAAFNQHMFTHAGGILNRELNLGCLTPLTNSASSGVAIGVFPIFAQTGAFVNPFMNALVYAHQNIAATIPLTFNMYNAARQYLPAGNTRLAYTSPRATNPEAYSILMRYD